MECKEFKRGKEDEHKKMQVLFNHGKEWKKLDKYTWTKNTGLFLKMLSRSHSNN